MATFQTSSKIVTALVVKNFNEAINSRDLARLSSLISDDHTFVDYTGSIIKGKKASVAAWENFFRQFPDYQNVFDRIIINNNLVAITGHSSCLDKRLNGPALWKATIEKNLIKTWRIY